MSTQHGNLPEVRRAPSGGRNRRPAPFRLWYRVTYMSTHDGEHSYVINTRGRYHSEDERQRVMDKVAREQVGRSTKVEFFFVKPAPARSDW